MAHQHKFGAHVGLGLAEIICISAFIIELTRARSGNSLSWAYVVEWPFLGAYAVYMWRKLLHDDGLTASPEHHDAHDDEKLAAFNDYLARVHTATPESHDTPTN